MAEGNLQGDFTAIARVRKPVFSSGTLAMAVTMAAAIRFQCDTGVLPPIVHAMTPTAPWP